MIYSHEIKTVMTGKHIKTDEKAPNSYESGAYIIL
jgi:hypothetical protein